MKLRLRGFSVLMIFMKYVGKLMASSGSKDICVESGVFGENYITPMLPGHAFRKVVRGHKVTFRTKSFYRGWKTVFILCHMSSKHVLTASVSASPKRRMEECEINLIKYYCIQLHHEFTSGV